MATKLGGAPLGYGGLGWSYPDAVGISTIELESIGSGLSGITASGISTIELESTGSSLGAGLATGISTIELESIGVGVTGITSSGKSTIELTSNGICVATIIGIGQSNIELKTYGSGSYILVGTGRSIIEIVSSGTAYQGIVGIGNSIIEISGVGAGFTGVVGTGTASIVFTTNGLSDIIIIATAHTCIVINTKTGAVSEYNNYDFNSFCEFNDKILGCRADGIYELDGADDNGVDIDAYVKWGFLDPNLPTKSCLVEGFSSGKATGDIKVTTICDEDQSCEDILKYLISRRDHPVRIAKGFKGRLYETKIENVDGAGFTLNSYRILDRELKKQR